MRQDVVVDPSAGDGRHADDRLGALRQRDDPGEEDLAEGRRQTATLGVGARTEQLLDEERVAVGAPVDLRDELGRGRRIEDRGEERVRRGRIEPTEVDPIDECRSCRARRATAAADDGDAARRTGRS